jgi:hypothetical protein
MTELGQSQLSSTTIYEDNDACIKLEDSSAPTRQMSHIAFYDFTLQDWTDRDLVTLVSFMPLERECIRYVYQESWKNPFCETYGSHF